MPCGFTGQQPNGYDASIKVSCLLLLYLLMVSSQSILMLNRRKHPAAIRRSGMARMHGNCSINNNEELRTEQFPPFQPANRKNDLILIMTPEIQDKTLELSKHWYPDSTPARNEVIMKTTCPVNQ